MERWNGAVQPLQPRIWVGQHGLQQEAQFTHVVDAFALLPTWRTQTAPPPVYRSTISIDRRSDLRPIGGAPAQWYFVCNTVSAEPGTQDQTAP
jgi:hypothetical protein